MAGIRREGGGGEGGIKCAGEDLCGYVDLCLCGFMGFVDVLQR